MSRPSLKRDDYTLGWVCALFKEMAVAEEMLDISHTALPSLPGDDNNYAFGSINDINIVIACLPDGKMGTVSAAHVAKDMCRSFPSLRLGLMVGIGGGVPCPKRQNQTGGVHATPVRGSGEEIDTTEDGDKHVRLGDVVVSRPSGTSGGVVQYDFGKAKEHNLFERTGSLNRPPNALMAAVSKIRSKHERYENQIAEIVSGMVDRRPKMKAKYAFSTGRKDILFEPDSYHAKDQDTCRSCDALKIVSRPSRQHTYPVVHYGLIASGNQVMKSGIKRNIISDQAGGVLCFEMEAAGLMDTFPCLVIRGICDYCDGHKNDQWQEYAAAVAAAYAKELIGLLQASEVRSARSIQV